MAKYEPIGFKNEVPSTTPLKYKITDDTEGVIAESATIELETPVTPGTPLNAENLNHIEQGIVDLEASTPPGVFQAKGDLFVGAGSKTGVRLPIGANGRVLQADNTQASGMRWGYEYLRDMIAAKGDLLVGTSADSAARLPVGANGRVLRANSAAAQGVEWGVDPAIDLIAAKGDLVVGTGADKATRLPVGTNGQVLIADSAQSAGVAWFPLLAARQGGSSSNWTIGGTSNYEPGKFKIQIGAFLSSVSASISSLWQVTFPQAFSAPPIVIGPAVYSTNEISDGVNYTCYISDVDSSSFRFVITNWSNKLLSARVFWLAIGPA